MKKVILFTLCLLLFSQTVLAQDFSSGVSGRASLREQALHPTIQSGDSVGVGKNIIFSASLGATPAGAEVAGYLWSFGDGVVSSKEEVVHIFKRAGRYNVKLKTTLRYNDQAKPDEVFEYTKEVFVFERSIFLITDLSQPKERLDVLQRSAEDLGVYLNTIQLPINLRLKGNYLQRIEQDLSVIQNSDTVVIWSDRADLLTILNNFSSRLNFQQKDIVVVTDANLGFVRNILRGTSELLLPQQILITRREAVNELLTLRGGEDPIGVIRSKGYELVVISRAGEEFNLFKAPSYGVTYLQKKGVDDSIILAIIFLPVIVTLATFLQLIIGLSSAGNRVPIIFTYTLLVLGWKFGVLVIAILALITHFFRAYLFRSHLLYAAKVGVLTSTLGLALLFILGVGALLGYPNPEFSGALMLITLAAIIDRLAGVEGERSFIALLFLFLETFIISIFCFLLVSWSFLQILIVSHPEVLLLFIAANVFMGRFTGLRLMEYFRFRELIRYAEEE